jgi:hypothetical protein
MPSPQFNDPAHVCWMPIEMHGYDCFGSRANGTFQLCRVEAVCFRLNVDKYGYGTNHSDCGGRSASGMGYGYDLVTLSHIERLQR